MKGGFLVCGISRTDIFYCYNKDMRTLVVYKEQSEHARAVETFMHDFTKQTGKILETLDPESREGADMCRTYDIVEYPTVVALGDDGVMLTMWRGVPLPTISEVSYYAR